MNSQAFFFNNFMTDSFFEAGMRAANASQQQNASCPADDMRMSAANAPVMMHQPERALQDL